ncbi:hypothetical protein [Bradyrhizobium denitrificans]|uniref:hypothetical protein n=1 Tax=Bradyrhizobium denitrificans TaxID=2734912 RepID=UPI001557A090|nr:hypothetical protein [Bradyrhizobium sp. LMG 8443]NPU23923.1 hypothetical protein [Bradyrhizobium sp. LMG 8443]
MTTRSSDDIVAKVVSTIPRRWFKWVPPIRNAVIGGAADGAAWCYGLIGYARAQTRLASAYGIWLDLLARDFVADFLVRGGANDDTFRARLRATILQERVTRKGMIAAVTALTGNTPVVFEPWHTGDTGAYSGAGAKYGQFGYGVGSGGYGNMNLPAQIFMKVKRGAPSGVPNVGGWSNKNLAITTPGGYGAGSWEYLGPSTRLSGITDAMIYDVINKTKPTGVTVWVAFV